MWNGLVPYPHVVDKNPGGISWKWGVAAPYQASQPRVQVPPTHPIDKLLCLYYRLEMFQIVQILLVLQFPPSSGGRLYCDNTSGIVGLGTTSYCFSCRNHSIRSPQLVSSSWFSHRKGKCTWKAKCASWFQFSSPLSLGRHHNLSHSYQRFQPSSCI